MNKNTKSRTGTVTKSTNALKAEIHQIRAEFKETWRKILDDLLNEPKFKEIHSSIEWLTEVLEKNVTQGKQTRALMNIFVYRSLKPDRTAEEDFLNYVNGWIIEILQAGALIADDIMDNSDTRRGMPCWYKQENVGLSSAINDVFVMENFSNWIAFKYFSGQIYFGKWLEFYQYNNLYTVLGESMDLNMATNDEVVNFDRFTESTYKALVKYKTSYYTFHWPVICALVRAGIQDEICYTAVEHITLKIGELFQIQDDFLDCYGNPDVTGKIGTDIRDGKLTWLLVKALQLASESQLEILHKEYGQSNPTMESEVKRLYEELGIEDYFYQHEDALKLEIVVDIKALPNTIPHEPFLNVLDTIYRREK